MPKNFKELYLDHFVPLASDFCDEVKALSLEGLETLPQPFLPLFGEGYERSALRMVIVGQDTKWCGNLAKFLADPSGSIETEFRQFQNYDFVGWGKRADYFFGFVMKFMAELHGVPNWTVMKRREHQEILGSFGYGNVYAVEIFASDRHKISREAWSLVQRAGARLNGIGNLIKTLRPRVIIVLCKGMNPKTWFSGYPYECLGENARIWHYRIPSEKIDVFQVPHPSGRNGMKRQGGAGHFSKSLVSLMQKDGLMVNYPQFLNDGSNDAEKVLSHLKESVSKRANKLNKFEFIEWVAEELKKRKCFMSVPTLCTLLNVLGYKTNYGTKFSAKRGSYKLVSGTYHRLDAAGKGHRARMVAEAFRKPNFEYAYAI